MAKNNFLFSVKAIAAYFVIFIHCQFPSTLGVYAETLARFAVPLFFMVSGFYAYNKSNAVLKKNALKVLKLVFISNSIYIAYYILRQMPQKMAISDYLISVFSAESIFKFIVVNEGFAQQARHLWFLSALFFCYVAFIAINRFKLNKVLPILALLLLSIHLVFGEVFSFLGQTVTIAYVRNCWFMGLPFFLIGSLFNQYKYKIEQRNYSFSALSFALLLGSSLALLERQFSGRNELFLGSCITALSFFIMTIKFPQKYSENFMETIGEKYTLFIYISHPIVIWELRKLLKSYPEVYKYAPYSMPLLVCVFTTIAAYVFYKIQSHSKVMTEKIRTFK